MEMMYSHDEDKLRLKNLATVKKYLKMSGSRLDRHKLFTDDCIWGRGFTEAGDTEQIKGSANLAKTDEWNTRCFPDWKWTNIIIFQTQDPNYFWAECDGSGQAIFPGYPPTVHSAHFLHSFEMDNGKIKVYREFFNPVKELLDFGYKVPQLKRE